MEHDADYYDRKWKAIIGQMPVGGQYRFDIRKHGYQLAIDAIPSGSKVFDYACGLGVIDKMLIEKGCKVSGCDFSGVAVDYCKEQTGGDFRVTGDIFGSGYDVVIAAYFLEHIKNPSEWVDMALKKAPRVICHLPRNFRHHGEHVDMGWNSWGHFKEVFKDFDFKRLDTKPDAPFDAMADDQLIYPRIGQFAHPIVEFNKKGATMHINARAEAEKADKKEKPKKKIIEKVKKITGKKRGKKKIEITEETDISTDI